MAFGQVIEGVTPYIVKVNLIGSPAITARAIAAAGNGLSLKAAELEDDGRLVFFYLLIWQKLLSKAINK